MAPHEFNVVLRTTTEEFNVIPMTRVSRHHINHPVFSYATISTRQLQTTARSVRDWMMCSRRSVWNMTVHQPETIRTLYSISSSRINLQIFEICGSSTQHLCRIQCCPRKGFCRILAGRVGSSQHFGFFSCLLTISRYLIGIFEYYIRID